MHVLVTALANSKAEELKVVFWLAVQTGAESALAMVLM